MKYKRLFLISTSLCIWILCILLGYQIHKIWVYRKNVFGAPKIIQLKKEDYIFPNVGEFQNYFEPKPDTIAHDDADWLGHEVLHTINNDGLNDNLNYNVNKSPDSYRIVALGDSFTYGIFVNSKDNYPKQLGNLLNNQSCTSIKKYEVINLGVPGYDIGFSVNRFKLHGQKYHPDLVLWLINDYNLTNFADYKFGLEKKLSSTISAEEVYAHDANGVYYYPGALAEDETTARFGKGTIIRQQAKYLDDFSHQYNGRLVIALSNPSLWDPVLKEVINNFAQKRPNTWVYEGLPVLRDIHATLLDGHPNVYGHSIIAKNLFNYLLSQGLIPCR
jgi:lysophospholipase L1-like esterase